MNAPVHPDQIPSAGLSLAARYGPGAALASRWQAPLDLVLAAPTASSVAAFVRLRLARGDRPLPIAEVYLHCGRLFAEIHYAGSGRPSLIFPTDIWPIGVGR